ncbi:MAG TPA: hypothetical protein VES20_25695, partial [Bryobacteraceae bacterium]|nr:hypothetical protein [Bryobacteraceae bacterium]
MPSSYAEALPTADRVISSAFPGFTVTHYTGPVAPDSITVDHPAVFFVPIGQEVTVICRMENSGETELTLTRNSVLISGSTRLQAVGWSTAAQMLRIELSDEVRSQLEDAGWVSDKKLHVVEDELL